MSDQFPPFIATPPFLLRKFIKEPIAFLGDQAAKAETALLEALESLPPSGLLEIDFTDRKLSSEAARRLLRRPISRVVGGELEDRYLVLGDIGDSLYNVQVMLESEGFVLVERKGEGPALIGNVDPAVSETYKYLLAVGIGTAGQVCDHFKLASASAATNRLSTLARLRLARRVDRRSVAGGGREYLYAAVK